jgi:hypothetical protein
MRLPELKGVPTQNDLSAIVKACEKNRDKYILQTWSGRGGIAFSVRAFMVGSGSAEYLRAKRDGKLGEPEWAFIRGTDHDKDVVWVHTTGDLGLLLNLILSEVEGQTLTPVLDVNSSLTNLAPVPMRRVGTSTYDNLKPIMTEPAIPDQPAPATPSGIVLAGDLKDIELQNVLQSIGLCKMSGALLLNNNLEQASIYFHDGEIVDATVEKGFSLEGTSDVKGDHAFLEVLTWPTGSFSFEQARRTSTTSITRKSYALLMEGVMLRDYCDNLTKRGVDQDTRFVQVNPAISEADFENTLKQGVPIDKELQKAVYLMMRTPVSVYEVLKNRPMNKAVWVPVIFNLLSLNLIDLADGTSKAAPQATVEAFVVDQSVTSSFHDELARPDTGLVSHAAFSFFVNRETKRFLKTGRPFSIIVFEVRSKRMAAMEPLNNDALRECSTRFRQIMGELDMIGHYQMLDFALLLPEGLIAEPAPLFDSCARVMKNPLLPGIESVDQLQMTFSLYAPDESGQILLKERKTYPSPR